jgi:hypothetical protein
MILVKWVKMLILTHKYKEREVYGKKLSGRTEENDENL